MMEDLCRPFDGITKDKFDGRESNGIQTHRQTQTDRQAILYYLTVTVHIINPEVLIHDGGPASSIWLNN